MKKLVAEFIGTLWLVLGGCGSAVLAAGFPEVGIGFVGVSLAFGLTVVTMAYAIGHISGCHLNPAVSIGLWMGGRFDAKDLVPYIIAQVMGGIAGAGILYLIVTNQTGFDGIGGFAANGFGEHSPGGFNMVAALVTEIVMTFIFLFVILQCAVQKHNGILPHPHLLVDIPHIVLCPAKISGIVQFFMEVQCIQIDL